MSANTPQRSSTINLGGLGRSRVTGLNTPANRGLRLDLTQSSPHQNVMDTSPWYQEASLNSAIPPVYLPRSNSERKTGIRPEARFKPLQRGLSGGRIDPTTDTDNRPGIVAQHVAAKIKGSVNEISRRSSIHSVYDKAKIRQKQLQRSTTAQFAFQYVFYLLIFATIYFLFVGVPLWNGLVLTILYLFQKKLVVPAGTAIFLGVGFL